MLQPSRPGFSWQTNLLMLLAGRRRCCLISIGYCRLPMRVSLGLNFVSVSVHRRVKICKEK